jgi:PTS system nitrogen regulatory IIA component
MDLGNLISPAGVFPSLRAANKTALLRTLSDRAAPFADLPAETIFTALCKREALGSTGVGAGVAIPHARLDGLAEPRGVFARLRPPIDYESIDRRPVDLVFLLLLPANDASNLQPLAAVARILRDPEKARILRTGEDARALYVLLAHSVAKG